MVAPSWHFGSGGVPKVTSVSAFLHWASHSCLINGCLEVMATDSGVISQLAPLPHKPPCLSPHYVCLILSNSVL